MQKSKYKNINKEIQIKRVYLIKRVIIQTACKK